MVHSKFQGAKDPQKWLLDRISEELEQFESSKRIWPDNWIVATNIDPSGVPNTGAFDQARRMVKKHRSTLVERFHIWGGSKILDMLAYNQQIASYYGHFLTPGHILTAFNDGLKNQYAQIEAVLRYLTVKEFNDQKFTRLEEAGSKADEKPGIHVSGEIRLKDK
jgi:hypothetical protein